MQAIVINTLRFGIALQAVGIGLQYLGLFGTWDDDSAVFSLLLYDWQWPQTTVQWIDDAGAWAYLFAGVALVVLPSVGWIIRRLANRTEPFVPVASWQWPLCVVVVMLQSVLTVVAWYRGGSFMSEWALASGASRIALPIALILLTPLGSPAVWRPSCQHAAISVLRVAACLTFVGHGLKSLYGSPEFVDFILAASEHVAWELSQSSAELLLRAIGALDLVLAALIVVTRWRWVAFYMAAWALIAAWARIVHSGWGAHFEVIVRAGNYCVPLAVGLYWQLFPADDPAHSACSKDPSNASKTNA